MGELTSFSEAIVAGLLIGTAGSLHCLGMCGPLVLSLPMQSNSLWRFFSERLIYHFGRISIYAILGTIGGIIGGFLAIGRWQQTLSVFWGILLIVAALYVSGKLKLTFLSKLKLPFRNVMFEKAGRTPGILRFWITGMANGLLPCGLVYIALAGSLSGGNALWGATYMSAFGLGSVPVLLLVSWLGLRASDRLRPMMKRLVPYALFLTGILLTLRGMDLGIPMLSPELKQTASQKEQVMECCKKPSQP